MLLTFIAESAIAQEESTSLKSQYLEAINKLNDIQIELKSASNNASNTSKRISILLKELTKLSNSPRKKCIKSKILIKKLNMVITKFNFLACGLPSFVEKTNCIPDEIILEFRPKLKSEATKLETLIKTNSNDNKIPDICEEK